MMQALNFKDKAKAIKSLLVQNDGTRNRFVTESTESLTMGLADLVQTGGDIRA